MFCHWLSSLELCFIKSTHICSGVVSQSHSSGVVLCCAALRLSPLEICSATRSHIYIALCRNSTSQMLYCVTGSHQWICAVSHLYICNYSVLDAHTTVALLCLRPTSLELCCVTGPHHWSYVVSLAHTTEVVLCHWSTPLELCCDTSLHHWTLAMLQAHTTKECCITGPHN